ncbi:hypothetical protein K2P97_00600 [bacterium]|nr:hypothetical protein [bacterium]
MNQSPRRNLWPYDELSASRESEADNKFILSAPWLTRQFRVDNNDVQRAEQISKKISDKKIGAEDLNDVNWFLSSFSSYPFAYILPRNAVFGSDLHDSVGNKANLSSPRMTLKDLVQNPSVLNSVNKISEDGSLTQDWTWDTEAALEFSKTTDGYDPESLFSIARRFHLLNDMENNQTADLFNLLQTFPKNSAEFKSHAALTMRQNHYITENCERVLKAALPIAKGAYDEISEFIQAESGHDKILAKALTTLDTSADQTPALPSTIVLMELFYLIAKRNILAFSMVVDIFERTSYLEEDPFASVLKSGGAEAAASRIEVHREINDASGHENVGIGFLKDMKPVTAEYATEALKLAELLTQVIHLISKETLEQIKAQK